MPTATLKRVRAYGPGDNGILMTPQEFDRAKFVEGWRYELINGVMVVTSSPLPNERDPNGELDYLLRAYRDSNPHATTLVTLSEHTVFPGPNRRRADRVIWIGLERLPDIADVPNIIVEFVSAGRRSRERDYEAKRDEYLAIGVEEYWIIDRFEQVMTVFIRRGQKARKRVIRKDQTYKTDLLPGFELPLSRLFKLADRWREQAE